MCTGTCKNNLFKQIIASLPHGLDTTPESLAGPGHGGPQEVGHHLRNLGHQAGCCGGLCLQRLQLSRM